LTKGEHDNDFEAYQINRRTKAYRNAAKSPVVASTPVTYLTYWNRLPVAFLRILRGNPEFSLKLIHSFLLKRANGIVNLVEGPDDHDLDNYLARFRQEKRKIVSNESSEDDQKELSDDDSTNNAGQQEPKRQRTEEMKICTNVETAPIHMSVVDVLEQTPTVLEQNSNCFNGAGINTNGARRVVPTKPLVLNGLVIEVDPDTFMVNATQMCKAAGKFFAEYHRSKCYKDFEKELSEAMGIPIGELTSCENGNRKGSMVHRRIAIHLAHRISPAF